MCAAAAEDVRKARGPDRFQLAPVRLARAVTPGSTNGDARICEKRFLGRCFLPIFFIPLVCFFFQLFISRPRHLTVYTYQYHIIPRYYTAYTVLPLRQRHFAEFDQFLTLYRSVIGAIPLPPPPP